MPKQLIALLLIVAASVAYAIGAPATTPPQQVAPQFILLTDWYSGRPVEIRADAITVIEYEEFVNAAKQKLFVATLTVEWNTIRVKETPDTVKRLRREALAGK